MFLRGIMEGEICDGVFGGFVVEEMKVWEAFKSLLKNNITKYRYFLP